MAKRMVRGDLVGVVDGPAMILNLKGEEQKFGLAVNLPVEWVAKNMERPVTVMVEDGRVTEVM